MTALLERLAPHWPPEDQAVDGPDRRSFWQRLLDEDERRSQRASTLWASRHYKQGVPFWELSCGLMATRWALGIDVEFGQIGDAYFSVALGPWSMCLRREIPR